jgi:cytochrome oxidase assembly protein ShyY1
MLKLALSFKWITGLLLSLLLGVAFSLLAQWQLSRAVVPNSGQVSSFALATVNLQDVAKPAAPFTFNEFKTSGTMGFLTQVETKVIISPAKAILIANRFQQNGEPGYWVVVPGNVAEGNVFVALGFVSGKQKALSELAKLSELPAVAIDVTGRYLPSEEPVPVNPDGVYSSLSIPQLLNSLSWKAEQVSTYAGFIADTSKNIFVNKQELSPLVIGLPKTDNQVNWLSSFYAIEWTFFAGFAVFMWWRLLADSYRKQQAQLLS